MGDHVHIANTDESNSFALNVNLLTSLSMSV